MFSHQPIFILILISYIIYITSNDNGYLKMTDEMEKPFKQYLKFSFSNNLNPGIKFQKSEKPKI